jgi:hypothetical protein
MPYGDLCDALNKRGQPCGCRMVRRTKNGRLLCRFHGGAATGPKTPEGKKRSGENLRRWWAAQKSASEAK